MKKCRNCKIVFHHPDRVRCLYCETPLVVLEDNDPVDDAIAFLSTEDDAPPVLLSTDIRPLEQVIRGREPRPKEARVVIGNYFKSRTFYFFYGLSRNELKMGQVYKRFFVQPFNLAFFLMIPWAVINVVDSLFFHLRGKPLFLKMPYRAAALLTIPGNALITGNTRWSSTPSCRGSSPALNPRSTARPWPR